MYQLIDEEIYIGEIAPDERSTTQYEPYYVVFYEENDKVKHFYIEDHDLKYIKKHVKTLIMESKL